MYQSSMHHIFSVCYIKRTGDLHTITASAGSIATCLANHFNLQQQMLNNNWMLFTLTHYSPQAYTHCRRSWCVPFPMNHRSLVATWPSHIVNIIHPFPWHIMHSHPFTAQLFCVMYATASVPEYIVKQEKRNRLWERVVSPIAICAHVHSCNQYQNITPIPHNE